MNHRPGLVIIDTPTLLEGAPQLLAAAHVEWLVARPSRHIAEAIHQLTTGDCVITPQHGVAWL